MTAILVRAPNWIGDQVIARPFFAALRAAHPGAHVAAACVPWVADLQYRDLVDEVFVLPGRGGRAGSLTAAALRARRARRWDAGVSLPNSFSAAWYLRLAGARERVGYASGWRSLLLNRPRPWPPAAKEHRVRTYLRLAEELGSPGAVPAAPAFDPLRAWPEAVPIPPPAEPYWVLAPGAAAESRRWPADRFAHLARIVLGETGLAGVVVGGAAERSDAARLCAEPFTKLADLTGRGPAGGLWRVFAAARFVVANDSGLAHLAALCGARVHVVWGGGDPDVTHPLGPGRADIVSRPVPCWPCSRNRCTQPRTRFLGCLTGITPAEVWEGIARGAA